MSNESPLSKKADEFAVRIVKMVKYLDANGNRSMKALFNQVLRSGTSISANIEEAQFAQSKSDFITKLYISLKEANETRKWLTLLLESECLTANQHKSMETDLSQIIAMLVSSINTAKNNN